VNVSLREVEKDYGALPVLSRMNLDFAENSFSVILGPSGCGKTSLLRMITGLIEPSHGSLGDIDRSKISFVFQEPRLIPWLSVEDNIRLVLPKADSIPGETERLDHILELVELREFRRVKPRGLSGGMRQRVSLARAFAPRGKELLLLDEPFQGLDLRLKIAIMSALVRLWENEPKTVILVTHDVQEALYLAQRVVVLSPRPAHVLVDACIPGMPGSRDLSQNSFLGLEHDLIRTLLADGETGGAGVDEAAQRP
jgi:NitT/TauT family transport system ATP-binding protein